MLSYFNQFSILYTITYLSNFLLPIFFIFSIIFIFNSKLLCINSYNIYISTLNNIFNSNIINIKRSVNITGYLSLVNTILISILLINIYGLLPYTFSLSSHISITIGLSLFIVLLCILNSFNIYKINFFSTFTPIDSPIFLAPFLVIIETVSYIARIISLGVRLAANISAGHLLILIISNFGFIGLSSNYVFFTFIFPVLLLLFIIVLEIAVSIIQSYIFSLLTCIYLIESNHQH